MAGSAIRRLWHCKSEGWGYCVLGTHSATGIPAEILHAIKGIPVRDRYSNVMVARLAFTVAQIRRTAPADIYTKNQSRRLYFWYEPWSSHR
ncbi:hypothetical protein [Cupriavidus sp. H39]|uniref:hypothetical protein n=1 Tax=Cupriavidus sp. H39 TaxID=3401635 RepID=UPI003CFE033A